MHRLAPLVAVGLVIALAVLVQCEDREEEKFVPPDAGCGPAGSCIAPCAPGNSIGVGRECTAGGGQCGWFNGRYLICTADHTTEPLAPKFCTWPCDSNSDCAEQAACVHSSVGNGCVPAPCLPEDWDGGFIEFDAGTG